jgi:hypothetical protein
MVMNSQFDENEDHAIRLEIVIPLSGHVFIHADTCECIRETKFEMHKGKFDSNYTVQEALIILVGSLYRRLTSICSVPANQDSCTITYNQDSNLDILSMGENNVKHPTIQ